MPNAKNIFLFGTFRGEKNHRKIAPFIGANFSEQSYVKAFFFEFVEAAPRGIFNELTVPIQEVPRYLNIVKFSLPLFLKGIFGILKRSGNFFEYHDALEVERYAISGKGSLWVRLKKIVRAVCGFASIIELLDKINPTAEDVVLIWGHHGTTFHLLEQFCRRVEVKMVYANWGDLPNTYCFDTKGVYGDSSVVKLRSEFSMLPILESERKKTEKLVASWLAFKVTDRVYSIEGVFPGNGPSDSRKTIYVNGIDEIDSGIIPRNTAISLRYSPKYETNAEVLEHVAKIAEKEGWQVLYKDHPNVALRGGSRSIGNRAFGENVTILGNIDIHEVLKRSNIVVSLPSKTTILALAYNKPVVQLGRYIIQHDDLKFGLYDGSDLEESLKTAMKSSLVGGVDLDSFYDFLTRLRIHYLFDYSDIAVCRQAAADYFENIWKGKDHRSLWT